MSTAVINKIESILHSAYDTKNYMDFVNKLQGNGREYKTALEGMIRDYQE